MKYKAFLFDLNGTMINDLSYHVHAWYRILNELGANISKERAKAECYGKNQELPERVLPGRFSEKEKNKISLEKERQYQKEFSPNLELINGLGLFLEKSKKAGKRMAIGSAKDCLVFEDAPTGAESARNAGMDCVIITTSYKPGKFRNYNNIIHFIEDYNNFTIS